MTTLPVVKDILRLYEEGKATRDPRTKNWFLLNDDPVYVWIITAVYICFVMVGPRFMKNRPAYSFPNFMVIYNLGLVALSAYMLIEIVASAYAADYFKTTPLCCEYNANTIKDPRELRVANVLWIYFFSKALELMDTVMMILRKKNNQVTFLHVFHHSSMLNFWWWVMMYNPGGQSWFSSSLNCSVHVVMYLYYALAGIPSLREKLWWKKYITKFQLFQFVLTLIHTVQTMISGCDFPMWGQVMLTTYMFMMLALFGNFYFQAYLKKTNAHKKKTDEYQNGKEEYQNGKVTAVNGTANGVRHR